MIMHVPTSMATQHPDSASRYVPIQEESEEALEALTPQPEGLGIEEVMVDFEGKMTPYHQTAEIVQKLLEKGLIPGENVWVTPRVSSATDETVFRQLMALMSVIEADYDLAKQHPDSGSIKEVILPMVRGSSDLVEVRKRIADIIELARKEFKMTKDSNSLQVIALIEGIPTMLNFGKLYADYLSSSLKLGFAQNQLRFMIGRSDSALSYGLVSSVLATKIMISQAYRLGKNWNLPVAPILGGGALPFRGHISLENIDNVLADYPGIRTVTIQSGIRYDHQSAKVKRLVTLLKQKLPTLSPRLYQGDEETFLKNCIAIFAKEYIKIFSEIVEPVAALSDVIPRQRDRLTRRGPGGYARPGANPRELADFASLDKIRLELNSMEAIKSIKKIPRAISFTGAMYSVGLPPEFLGVGDGLSELVEIYGKEGLQKFLALYPGLRADLKFAGRFLHFSVAKEFFLKPVVEKVKRQIAAIEELLGIDIVRRENQPYQTLLEIITPLVKQASKGNKLGDEDVALLRSCMTRLGKLRGSLG